MSVGPQAQVCLLNFKRGLRQNASCYCHGIIHQCADRMLEQAKEKQVNQRVDGDGCITWEVSAFGR